MLSKKDLFGCSGIAAAITGVVIGAALVIHTHIQCKKEEQEMNEIMKDIADKSREVDELLDRLNLR
jgi:hypothetical protein